MPAKSLTAVIILGLYCVVLSLGLAIYLFSAEKDQAAKGSLYAQVEGKLAKMEKEKRAYLFRNDIERDRADELLDEMRDSLKEFYQQGVDRIAPLAAGSMIVGIMLAGVYFVTGIGALVPLSWVKKTVPVGLGLWVVYLLLVIFNTAQEIEFLDGIFVRIVQLAYYFNPVQGVTEYQTLVRSLTNFSISRSVFMLAIGSFFCFIIPLYGLMRPSVQEALKQTDA